MNLAPLLVLPIVGGFGLISVWTITRYQSARQSGHRLYFRAIFYALALTVISIELHLICFSNPWYQKILVTIADAISHGAPVGLWSTTSNIAILVATVFIGPVIGHILNVPRLAYLQGDWGEPLAGLIQWTLPSSIKGSESLN